VCVCVCVCVRTRVSVGEERLSLSAEIVHSVCW
jgi:hypothetical protein